MLNGQDLNSDSFVGTPGDLDGLASLSLPRGNVAFRVQVCRGATNVALPTGSTVFFGVKGKDSTGDNTPKGDWLAMAQLDPVSAGTGLYEAAPLALNTPEMIAATHADPTDSTPEVIELPVYGQLFYFLPGETAPHFSQLIDVTVTAVLWTGVEGIAPSAMVAYPPAANVYAAIDKANAAEPGLGNPSADGGILSSLASGVRSWLASGAFGRTLLGLADLAAATTALALGTAAACDTGTAAGNVVTLDGSARLPAVDGSLLRGVTITGSAINPTSTGATTPGTGAFTTLSVSSTSSFAGAATFTAAPVFSNQSGARSALGLGTLATQSAGSVNITGGFVSGLTTLGISGSCTVGSLYGSGALTIAASGANHSVTVVPTGTGVFAVTGSSTISGTLAVAGNATFSGTLAVTGIITGPNLAPYHSVAVGPSASSTTYASNFTSAGSDITGSVTLHVEGGAPSAGDVLGTITFGTAYAPPPRQVILIPANQESCAVTFSGGAQMPILVYAAVASDGSGFDVLAGVTFPTSTLGTYPEWTYLVIQ